MAFIHFVLFFYFSLLQFEGVKTDIIYRSHRAGEDVSLPCDRVKHHGPLCSRVKWVYYRHSSSKQDTKVSEGQVQDSPGSSRLTLNTDCSLTVHNVTGEDAGGYRCYLSGRTDAVTSVYLSVLTVSPAPSTSPKQDGRSKLQCTLSRYSNNCYQNSFQWFDSKRKVLPGAGITQNNCVSYLTVESQSQHNRNYTCQYEDGTVQVSAEYTLLGNSGVSLKADYIFSKAGEDTTLSCDKHQALPCSSLDWIYKRDPSSDTLPKVSEGQVQDSPSSSRLTLNSDCSLTVLKVTEADSGLYTCRLLRDDQPETDVYLSVLTISPAPSIRPNQDDHITLQCTLWRYSGLPQCTKDSFRWLNINGAVLSGDGITQNNCVSNLTVEPQSQHNRNYTCQYVENNTVLTSAEYTLLGNSDSELVFIISGAVVSVLVLHLMVIALIFIISSNSGGDTPPDSEVKSCVSFEIINHQHVTPSKKLEEEQKYSTVKTYVRAEEDRESSLHRRNLAVHFYAQ